MILLGKTGIKTLYKYNLQETSMRGSLVDTYIHQIYFSVVTAGPDCPEIDGDFCPRIAENPAGG